MTYLTINALVMYIRAAGTERLFALTRVLWPSSRHALGVFETVGRLVTARHCTRHIGRDRE